MDAPTYPPATAFEPPIAQPQVLRVDDFSLTELMPIPAAWDIVIKHLPAMKMMAGTSMLKQNLGNFTMGTLEAFAPARRRKSMPPLTQLARLPPVTRAAP